jgi:hypothetical protein
VATFFIWALTLVFFSTPSFNSQQAFGASICDSGVHWVDTCGGGTNTFSIVMRFGLTTNISGLADYEAQFEGTMTVSRSDPVASDVVNNPLHLDFIDTEILSMNLVGTSAEVNGWVFSAGADQGLAPTTGFIQESGDPSIAMDWTDLIFVIEGTPYGTLHHDGSLFFAAAIDRFPSPGTAYKHTGSPFGTNFPLYDINNNFALKLTDLFGTDWITVGRPEFVITSAVPVPPAIIMFVPGLLGLLLPSAIKNFKNLNRLA